MDFPQLEQWNKNPGCLGSVGDEKPTQLKRDYNKPWEGSLLTKVDVVIPGGLVSLVHFRCHLVDKTLTISLSRRSVDFGKGWVVQVLLLLLLLLLWLGVVVAEVVETVWVILIEIVHRYFPWNRVPFFTWQDNTTSPVFSFLYGAIPKSLILDGYLQGNHAFQVHLRFRKDLSRMVRTGQMNSKDEHESCWICWPRKVGQ